MGKLYKNLKIVPGNFFEDDKDNLAVTGLGFAISAVCMAMVWLVY